MKSNKVTKPIEDLVKDDGAITPDTLKGFARGLFDSTIGLIPIVTRLSKQYSPRNSEERNGYCVGAFAGTLVDAAVLTIGSTYMPKGNGGDFF